MDEFNVNPEPATAIRPATLTKLLAVATVRGNGPARRARRGHRSRPSEARTQAQAGLDRRAREAGRGGVVTAVLSRPRLAALMVPLVAVGAAGTAVGPSPAAGVLVVAVSLTVWAAVEKALRP